MEFTQIVSHQNDFGIGKEGIIPWHQEPREPFVAEDLLFFRAMTEGHIVVMGYKTWKSLPKNRLDKRINIVLMKSPENAADVILSGCCPSYDISDIQSFCQFVIRKYNLPEEVFIIGGEKTYKEFLDITTKIISVTVPCSYDCDNYYFDPIKNGFKESLAPLVTFLTPITVKGYVKNYAG